MGTLKITEMISLCFAQLRTTVDILTLFLQYLIIIVNVASNV